MNKKYFILVSGLCLTIIFTFVYLYNEDSSSVDSHNLNEKVAQSKKLKNTNILQKTLKSVDKNFVKNKSKKSSTIKKDLPTRKPASDESSPSAQTRNDLSPMQVKRLERTMKEYLKHSILPSNQVYYGDQKVSSDPIETLSENLVSSRISARNKDLAIQAQINKRFFIDGKDTMSISSTVFHKEKIIKSKIKVIIEEINTKQVVFSSYLNSNANGKNTLDIPVNFLKDSYSGNFSITLRGYPALSKIDTTKDLVFTFLSFTVTKETLKFNDKLFHTLNDEGDLLFNLSFQVFEKGNYCLEGTLYDQTGKLITSVEQNYTTTLGHTGLELKFHGYIFYSNKISGPLILKNVALKHIQDSGLKVLMSTYNLDYKTKEINWSEFNSSPYQDPEMLKKAKWIQSFLNGK